MILRVSLVTIFLAFSASAEISLQEIDTGNVAAFQHAGPLSELVCHPDGVHVLSASRDQCARLWNLDSGELVRRYTGQGLGDMWGVRWIKGGAEFLAANSAGRTLRFDVTTGKVLEIYEQKGDVYRLAVHPDESCFVATDSKNTMVLWDLATGESRQTFMGHKQDVYSVVFVNEGRHLISASEDDTLRKWEVATGECVKTVRGDPGFGDVYTVVTSPDRKRVAMVCESGHVYVFEAETMAKVWATKLAEEGNVLAWSPDGKYIASTCDNRQLYLLNAETGEIVRTIYVERRSHTPITFTTDSRGLVSGGDWLLYRYEVETGRKITTDLGEPKSYTYYDGIAVGELGTKVYLANGTELSVVDRGNPEADAARNEDQGIETLELSPDGSILALGLNNNGVVLRSTDTLNTQATLGTRGAVNAISFLSDGLRLVSGGRGKVAELWDTQSGERLRFFPGHKSEINDLAVVSDEEFLITASDDGRMMVWSLLTGENEGRWTIPGQTPYAIASFGDGRSLIVATGREELWGQIRPELEAKTEVDEEALGVMVERLSSAEYDLREKAMAEIAELGKPVVPFIEKLEAREPEVRARLQRVKSLIKGVLETQSFESVLELEDDVMEIEADPLGEFWVGRLGSEGAAKLMVGTIDWEAGALKVAEILDNQHGVVEFSFSADGSHLGVVNADGTWSLYLVTRD